VRYALLSLLLASAFAQTVPPATPADKPKEPTAAQQFKNIQVLKDVPVREWFPTMAFISGSLGVGCDHCHVNPFPKDDKPAKARAREMMRMVQQINAQNFPDQPNRVTCMTCHNGSTKPARAPAVTSGKWFSDYTLASVKAPGTPAAPPDAAAIIAKYRAAIGTKNASIRSRYYKGVVTSYNGSSADAPRSFAQEVYIAGEHVRVEVTGPQGTTITVYDGHEGWVVTPKETHAMDAEDLEQLRNNVLRNLQLDYLPQYTQAAVRGAEQLRGTATWAVDLTNPDGRGDRGTPTRTVGRGSLRAPRRWSRRVELSFEPRRCLPPRTLRRGAPATQHVSSYLAPITARVRPIRRPRLDAVLMK